MKPIRSVWFYPFVVKNNKLKPNLRLNSKKFNTGVYLIKELKSNKIVYVGFSQSNLHRTLYRHFYKWGGQYRAVFKKSGFKVRIIFCSPAQALKYEKILIQKYKERGEAEFNRIQYDLDFELNKNKPVYIEAENDLKDIVTAKPNEDLEDMPF